MNWTELPDLAAVLLLAGAFASVARRNQTNVAKIWLTGWLMMAAHFTAILFLNSPGVWGNSAEVASLSTLTWAGLLFSWASVPYRQEGSSRSILISLIAANTVYLALSTLRSVPGWALNLSAGLIGILPLGVALSTKKRLDSPLRWVIIGIYCALSIFLLIIQHRPGNSLEYAQDGVLFTVYIGCCIHFWYAFRRATVGAFIIIAGFLAWACVFLVAPLMGVFLPAVQVEPEVWNLPPYVVAVGMILLLLEDQIEHSVALTERIKHLAFHDSLTGLANRHLFEERMAGELEHARQSKSQMALLVVDLDRFKQINDTLGHQAGDEVLRQVSELFLKCLRLSDTAARTGGDEFSLILATPTSRDAAAGVAQSIKQILQEPLRIDGNAVMIGASVGIALFPENGDDAESLCRAADMRMYDAKQRR